MTSARAAKSRTGRPMSRRQREQRRRTLMWALILGGISVLLVGAMVYAATRPQPGIAIADLGNRHIQPPQKGEYNTRPPTSGPHYTNIAPWGVHTEPISNELQVHNLEDGGVLVQYNCPEGCGELVAQLETVVSRFPEGVILAPYPDMDARIALTAWTRIDTFDDFDEERIERFIKAYQGIDHHR